ncbi:MAG: UvrD-helicase domain-containing protein [Halothece sp.]
MTNWTWTKWKKEYTQIPWNKYQLKVMEATQGSNYNLMVSARAGTGKTTLITALIPCLPSSKEKETAESVNENFFFTMEKPKREPYKITILAFNRHIADEIKNSGKLPNRVNCNTAHGCAVAILRQKFGGELKIDSKNDILNDIINRLLSRIGQLRARYDSYEQQKKLISQKSKKGELGEAECAGEIQKVNEEQKREFRGEYPPRLRDEKLVRAFKKFLGQLVSYAQKTLTTPTYEALLEMAEHYQLFPIENDGTRLLDDRAVEAAMKAVPAVLDEIERIATERKEISFDSMLWLIWKWKLSTPKRDVLIVDEAQDANPAQINLYEAFVKAGARIICVGDPAQAIQGFAGADHQAWENLRSKFEAIDLPLSECFRCDRAIIALAQKIIPDIEPRKDAGEGEVKVLAKEKITENLQAGDLLICRRNAPLIKHCLEALNEGFKATIRGREIGAELANLAHQFTQDKGGVKHFNWQECNQTLTERALKLKDELKEEQADILEDKRDCLMNFHYQWGNLPIEEFKKRIRALFNDDNRPAIVFSSIHRSKGDEGERVFILGCNHLPFQSKHMMAWQRQQELNIQYVAITRAKHSLFLVPIGRNANSDLTKEYGGMRFKEENNNSSREKDNFQPSHQLRAGA